MIITYIYIAVRKCSVLRIYKHKAKLGTSYIGSKQMSSSNLLIIPAGIEI